jgi:hypothetical protein
MIVMRKIAFIFIWVIFLGCSPFVASQDIINSSNFTFYDSYGRMYEIDTASSQVRKEYQLENKPIIIIIATNSTNQRKFIEQMKVIEKVNAEEFQYLYVLANSENEDNSGYFTTKTVASKLLSGKQFKIIINDQCGKRIKSSYQTINETEFKNCLTTAFSGARGPCAR